MNRVIKQCVKNCPHFCLTCTKSVQLEMRTKLSMFLVGQALSKLSKNANKKYPLKYYKYNELKEIGGGLIGKVYKANWKQNGKCLVKSRINSLKDICSSIDCFDTKAL
ncbi:kinase-like domain-containing protein [Rhizophagus irregularis DAOM 181602=DAOM 197198]|nr:kinase-like domain-containing protein [Rhizophagus irregularis DAOM 181602=DAOM 197198]